MVFDSIYKKCAQEVNVQYKVLTLYETKPGLVPLVKGVYDKVAHFECE